MQHDQLAEDSDESKTQQQHLKQQHRLYNKTSWERTWRGRSTTNTTATLTTKQTHKQQKTLLKMTTTYIMQHNQLEEDSNTKSTTQQHSKQHHTHTTQPAGWGLRWVGLQQAQHWKPTTQRKNKNNTHNNNNKHHTTQSVSGGCGQITQLQTQQQQQWFN